jgi:hypothetical protein
VRSQSQRRPIELVISVAVALLFLVVSENAQASCYKPGQRLPNNQIRDIKADPSRLLAQYPTGGGSMTSLIRDLVASDPATLAMTLDLTVGANADQISAIGTGLGEAALACAGTDEAFESEIRQMTASLGNELLDLAFAAAMGDQFVADPAGIGGGGGSTAENPSTGGSGGNSPVLNFGTVTQPIPNNFLTLNVATGGASAPTTPGAQSVSPSAR